jgi:LemA protein
VVVTLAVVTIAVLVVVGAALYVVGAYNQVVFFAREADRAFANIDVSLQQRHDEIPRLVDTCRAYMAHENSVLDRVATLRTQIQEATDVEGKVVGENALAQLLARVFVLAEGYPELKANELFLRLQSRLTESENEIADRRELFNASVTAYNTLIESFPALVLAGLFRWRVRSTLSLGVAR